LGVPIHEAEYWIEGRPGKFDVDEPSVLPCGRARLTIHADGFRRKTIEVDVSARTKLAVEELEVDYLEGAGSGSSVTFGISEFEKLRSWDLVKAVSLLNPDRRWDSRVSSRGHFGLDEVPMGVLAFVLTGPDGVCATATTVIVGDTKPEVLLKFTPAVTPVPKRSSQR